jgi:hypothetical protein
MKKELNNILSGEYFKFGTGEWLNLNIKFNRKIFKIFISIVYWISRILYIY